MKSNESYLGFEVQKIGGSRKDTVLQVVDLKKIYRNAFQSFQHGVEIKISNVVYKGIIDEL